jgi:hypothetical protein
MLTSPTCPLCGSSGIHFDADCIVWLCTRCNHPDGRQFTIEPSRAAEYVREYRERLDQLNGFVKRHYTPVPGRPRG